YEIEDKIGGVPASAISARCFNDPGANPTYDPNHLWRGLYQRSASGTAENVQSIDQNLGKNNIDGLDLQLDYSREVGPGNLRANLALTHLLKWQQQEDPASPLTDQEGTIGIEFGETFPEWKGRLSLGYAF